MYLLSLYRNKMPVVLKGGLPLAHVMDVAAGHVLAMENAEPGSRYILSGKEEDNRYLKDMCRIICEALQSKFPNKKFRPPQLEIPESPAIAVAFITEQFAKLFDRPMLLSCGAVRAGSYPSFYTSRKAQSELGYTPRYSFRQAMEEMISYYESHGLMGREGRWIDRR